MEAAFCPRLGRRSHVDVRHSHGGAVGHRFTAYVLGSGVAGERGPRARQREGDEVYKKITPFGFPQRCAGARQRAERKRSGGVRWPYFWVTARRPFGNFGCHPTLEEEDSSTTFWTCFSKLAHPPNHTNPNDEFAPFGEGRGCPLAERRCIILVLPGYQGISAFFYLAVLYKFHYAYPRAADGGTPTR